MADKVDELPSENMETSRQGTTEPPDKEKPYACDMCSARFSVSLSLQRHKKIHTEEFKCHVCGKHFSSRYDLEIRHMHIHTKELPFKCAVCSKGFKTRKVYKEHTCANITSQIHTCNVCNERYLSEVDLIKHKESHNRKRKFNNGSMSDSKQSKVNKLVEPKNKKLLPPINTLTKTNAMLGCEQNVIASVQDLVSSDNIMTTATSLVNYDQQLVIPNGMVTPIPQQISVDNSNFIQTDSTLSNLVPVFQNVQADQTDLLYNQNGAAVTPGGFMNVINVADGSTVSTLNSDQLTVLSPMNGVQEGYATTQYVPIQPNITGINVNNLQNVQATDIINANCGTFIPTQNVSNSYTIQTAPTSLEVSSVGSEVSNLQTILSLPPIESMVNLQPTISDLSQIEHQQQQVNSLQAIQPSVNLLQQPQDFNTLAMVDNSLQTTAFQQLPQDNVEQTIQQAPTLLQQCMQSMMPFPPTSNIPVPVISTTLSEAMTCLPTQSIVYTSVANSSQPTSFVNLIQATDTSVSSKPGLRPIFPASPVQSVTTEPSHVQRSSSIDSGNTKPSSVSSPSKKSFQCSICNKKYYKQILLDKHMVLHTNPFVCKICGKKFITKAALELKHMLVHKTENDLKNNVSNDIDDILHAVSSEDYVIEAKEDEVKIVKSHPIDDGASRQSIDTAAANDSPSASSLKSKITPFCCGVCGKKYMKKIHLDNHMAIHTNPVSCPICEKKFSSQEILETKHMPIHKAESRSDRSSIDDILLAVSNSDFVIEKKGNGNETGEPCEISALPVSSNVGSLPLTGNIPTDLLDPIKEEVVDEGKVEKPYSCQLCKKSYTLQYHLDRHMVIHNNPFICNTCGKKFASNLALLTHMKRYHGGDVTATSENFKKNDVIPVTDVEQKEASQSRIIHEILRAAVAEQQCAITATNISEANTANTSPQMPSLKNFNMKSNSPGNLQSKIKCPHCPKKYLYKINLETHMKVHTDPVICNKCGKKFANKEVLEKIHKKKCQINNYTQSPAVNTRSEDGMDLGRVGFNVNPSENTSEMINPMKTGNPDQGMAFVSKQIITTNPDQNMASAAPSSNLSQRSTSQPQNSEGSPLFAQERIAQAVLNDKPFQCTVCSKRYSNQANLAKHMVIHRNPFVCKICGKKFLSKAALELKHMPTHETNYLKSGQRFEEAQGIMTEYTAPEAKRNGNHEGLPVPVPVIIKQENISTSQEVGHRLKPLRMKKNLVKNCKCPYCPNSYFSQKKLNIHLEKHSKKFACEICGKTFTSQKILEERHMPSHYKSLNTSQGENAGIRNILNINGNLEAQDSGHPMLSCKICNKQYADERFLKNHMVLHTNPFICKICGRKFSSRHALEKKHMLTHMKLESSPDTEHNLEANVHRCCFCRRAYTFKKNLLVHLEGHTKPAVCKLCGKECREFSEMEQHSLMHLQINAAQMKQHQVPAKKKLNPPTLQLFAALVVMSNPIGDDIQQALAEKLAVLTLEKLEQEEQREQEIIADNESGDQKREIEDSVASIKCPFCDRVYSQKQYLDRHIILHTNPFVCKICGKAFASRYALEAKHMLMHSSETPFRCTICKHGFKELRRLRDHVKKKHASVTPHVCKKCGFRFVEASELKQHVLSHVKQAYHCGDCRKKYFSQAALTEHMKCHTGQRTAACEVCGKTFVCQSTFNKHLLYTDKENKQYVCQPCSHSFTNKPQFYVLGLVFESKAAADKEKSKILELENELVLSRKDNSANLENSIKPMPLTDIYMLNGPNTNIGNVNSVSISEYHTIINGSIDHMSTQGDISGFNGDISYQSPVNKNSEYDESLIQNSVSPHNVCSDSTLQSPLATSTSDSGITYTDGVSVGQNLAGENTAMLPQVTEVNSTTEAYQPAKIKSTVAPAISSFNVTDFKSFTDCVIGHIAQENGKVDPKTSVNSIHSQEFDAMNGGIEDTSEEEVKNNDMLSQNFPSGFVNEVSPNDEFSDHQNYVNLRSFELMNTTCPDVNTKDPTTTGISETGDLKSSMGSCSENTNNCIMGEDTNRLTDTENAVTILSDVKEFVKDKNVDQSGVTNNMDEESNVATLMTNDENQNRSNKDLPVISEESEEDPAKKNDIEAVPVLVSSSENGNPINNIDEAVADPGESANPSSVCSGSENVLSSSDTKEEVLVANTNMEEPCATSSENEASRSDCTGEQNLDKVCDNCDESENGNNLELNAVVDFEKSGNLECSKIPDDIETSNTDDKQIKTLETDR